MSSLGALATSTTLPEGELEESFLFSVSTFVKAEFLCSAITSLA